MTFPTDPAGRRFAMQRMVNAAPELMDEIAELRKQFPGSEMVAFKAPGIEYRKTERPSVAHTFTREWGATVRSRTAPPTPQVLEAQRLEKLRLERGKRSRGKK